MMWTFSHSPSLPLWSSQCQANLIFKNPVSPCGAAWEWLYCVKLALQRLYSKLRLNPGSSTSPPTLSLSKGVLRVSAVNNIAFMGTAVFPRLKPSSVTSVCSVRDRTCRFCKNRDRFTWVNSSHPHLNPPPSIGGGRIWKGTVIVFAMTIADGFRTISTSSQFPE